MPKKAETKEASVNTYTSAMVDFGRYILHGEGVGSDTVDRAITTLEGFASGSTVFEPQGDVQMSLF